MYEEYLFQSPLNEISDEFIRRVTGVNKGGRYHDQFNDMNNNNARNRRVSSMLFRNLSNELKREKLQYPNPEDSFDFRLPLNKRDPYAGFKGNLDPKIHGVTVDGIRDMENYAYKLRHPNTFGKDEYNKKKALALAALTPKKLPSVYRIFR